MIVTVYWLNMIFIHSIRDRKFCDVYTLKKTHIISSKVSLSWKNQKIIVLDIFQTIGRTQRMVHSCTISKLVL